MQLADEEDRKFVAQAMQARCEPLFLCGARDLAEFDQHRFAGCGDFAKAVIVRFIGGKVLADESEWEEETITLFPSTHESNIGFCWESNGCAALTGGRRSIEMQEHGSARVIMSVVIGRPAKHAIARTPKYGRGLIRDDRGPVAFAVVSRARSQIACFDVMRRARGGPALMPGLYDHVDLRGMHDLHGGQHQDERERGSLHSVRGSFGFT